MPELGKKSQNTKENSILDKCNVFYETHHVYKLMTLTWGNKNHTWGKKNHMIFFAPTILFCGVKKIIANLIY